MFPDSNTIYVVRELRRQDDLQEVARNRLAATAKSASSSKSTRHSTIARLQEALHRIGACFSIETNSVPLPSALVSQVR